MLSSASVRVEGSPEPAPPQTVYDISERGACLEADEALPKGQAVTISLRLAGRRDAHGEATPVRVMGRVVWSDVEPDWPGRIGVEFDRYATEADRARLMRAIESGALRRAA